MAKSKPETIFLKGDPVYDEREAGGAITPGHLVSVNGSNQVVVHASAGGRAAALFAKENDIGGDDITHAYASGEKVLFMACRPGDEVYAIIADGENIDEGDFLESNGNGELREVDADASADDIVTHSVIAVALEAINASDSATTALADRRCKVRIV